MAHASTPTRIGLGMTGCLHAGLALSWMLAMAGGFPALHRMSLANRWAPGAVLVMGLVAVAGAIVGSPRWARRGVFGVLGTWVGIGAAAPLVFPISASPVWLVSCVVGAVAAWIVHAPSHTRRLVALVPGIACGAALVWAQRSADPGTRPAGGELVSMSPSPCGWDGTMSFAMGGDVEVRANAQLVFQSVSPDRSWTALAPGESWRGIEPRCVAHRVGEHGVEARFEAEGEASLVARVDDVSRTMSIETVTRLPAPVQSHLNHYFVASITGGASLRLTLSPCPEHIIEPLSRSGPGQFAYLDSRGEFVIAQTSSIEKGPFEELCRAPPPEGGVVTLVVHEGARPVGWIRLHDFAAQADLGASPTAGWGVAANAIEPWQVSPGVIHLSVSLSATSVGRGWHSVGHRAGTYRNRVELGAYE